MVREGAWQQDSYRCRSCLYHGVCPSLSIEQVPAFRSHLDAHKASLRDVKPGSMRRWLAIIFLGLPYLALILLGLELRSVGLIIFVLLIGLLLYFVERTSGKSHEAKPHQN